MRIEIADKLFVEVSENKEICHTYTFNIIKKIRENCSVISPLSKERPLLFLPRNIYIEILGSEHPHQFTANFVPPDGSLILFCPRGTREISHSMMKIKGNKWIGSNNYNFLGVKPHNGSIVTSIGNGGNDGPLSYSLMDKRIYGYRVSGGWTPTGNRIVSFSDHRTIYDMYYVSIF